MIKTILKLLYTTNKKTFKGNSEPQVYPYVTGCNSIVHGSVWKNRKRRLQYKRWKIGPEKYIVRITDKGYEYEITATNIKIIKCVPESSSIFPEDIVLFESKNMTKDEHFNLALQVPMLSIDDFQRIRNFMERKDTRYIAIYMYMRKDWI